MLNLKKVAITGGLSCGKSTVREFFKELGAQILDADEIVHHLLSTETELGRQVIHLLGSDVVKDHKINRAKIAKKVFNNPKLLNELEKIIHPAVRKQIQATFQRAEEKKQKGIIAVEIPLLFEGGLHKDFDYTIAVITKSDIARQRFTESKGSSETDYENRMSRQLSVEEKAKRADFVLENNGDLKELKQLVKTIFEKINQSI